MYPKVQLPNQHQYWHSERARHLRCLAHRSNQRKCLNQEPLKARVRFIPPDERANIPDINIAAPIGERTCFILLSDGADCCDCRYASRRIQTCIVIIVPCSNSDLFSHVRFWQTPGEEALTCMPLATKALQALSYRLNQARIER